MYDIKLHDEVGKGEDEIKSQNGAQHIYLNNFLFFGEECDVEGELRSEKQNVRHERAEAVATCNFIWLVAGTVCGLVLWLPQQPLVIFVAWCVDDNTMRITKYDAMRWW